MKECRRIRAKTRSKDKRHNNRVRKDTIGENGKLRVIKRRLGSRKGTPAGKSITTLNGNGNPLP